MMDTLEAQAVNRRTAENLVKQAHRQLCVGGVEEAREMTRLALQFFARADHECDVIELPMRRLT